MPQSFVSLPVHIVFSTKNREPLIRDEMQTRLYEYVGGTLRAQKSKLVAAGGMQTCASSSVTEPSRSEAAFLSPFQAFQGSISQRPPTRGCVRRERDALTPG